MRRAVGWYAGQDDQEEPLAHQSWRPYLQLDDRRVGLGITFATATECDEFIRTTVVPHSRSLLPWGSSAEFERCRAALRRAGVRKDSWVRDLHARAVAGTLIPLRRRWWWRRPRWKNNG